MASERDARPGRVRLRPRGPARGRAPAAPDRVARDRRRPPVRRAARARRLERGLVRAARSTGRTARIFTGTADGAGGGRPRSRTTSTASTTRAAGRRRATSARSSRRSSTTSAHALDTLFARFKQRPFDHLVVGAPEELVAEVEERLHPYLRARARRAARHRRRELLRRSRAGGRGRGRRAPRRGGRARGARPHCSRASAAATAASRARTPVMEALEQARVEILLLAEDFDAPELDEALEKAITQSAQVIVVRHYDDLEHARRDRGCASLLGWRARSSSSTSRTTSRPAARSAVRDGDAIAGRVDASSPARASTSWSSRRATGTRPTTAPSPRRAGRGRSTACRGRPAPSCIPRSTAALVDVVVDKGQDPATEGYSGFEATGLAELLREHGIDDVTVVGLATDYCVKNTALDALRDGFGVTVDSTRGARRRAASRATGGGRSRRSAPRAAASPEPIDTRPSAMGGSPVGRSDQGGSMERHGSESYFVLGEGLLDESGGRPRDAAAAAEAAPPFRFSRMGPRGVGVQLGEPNRKKIADAMTAGGGGPSQVPAGFTYLGQFVDHDLTFDKTAVMLGENVSPAQLLQGRSPSLDLDSLYGAGPQDPARRSSTARRHPPEDRQDGRGRRRRGEERLRPPARRGDDEQGQAQGRDPRLPQRREPRGRADAPRVHPLPQPDRRQPAARPRRRSASRRRASSRPSTTSG